jgi:hypothetical protein
LRRTQRSLSSMLQSFSHQLLLQTGAIRVTMQRSSKNKVLYSHPVWAWTSCTNRSFSTPVGRLLPILPFAHTKKNIQPQRWLRSVCSAEWSKGTLLWGQHTALSFAKQRCTSIREHVHMNSGRSLMRCNNILTTWIVVIVVFSLTFTLNNYK